MLPSRTRLTNCLVFLTGAALLLLPAPASATSAGLKPSEAPFVSVGQHYFGDTAHTANGDSRSVDLWHLPPLLTNDAITIAWHSGGRPDLCLAQNIDDYNWVETGNVCNGSTEYRVADNDSARTVLEARSTTSQAYMEFIGCYTGECEPCNGCGWESQPYDFTIESIQDAIGVSITPTKSITPTSTLTGSANLSNGDPVTDGLAFTLTASWVTPGNKATHQRAYTSSSSGGGLSFPLNLPTSAEGKNVSFTVNRAADPQYLEATSSAVEIPVSKPPRGVALASSPVRVRYGRALIRLTCTGEGPCRGVIWLVARFHQGRHIHKAVIGKAPFSIPAGQAAPARINLNRRGRVLLHHARRHRLRVSLRGRGVKDRQIVLRDGTRRRHRRHHRHRR